MVFSIESSSIFSLLDVVRLVALPLTTSKPKSFKPIAFTSTTSPTATFIESVVTGEPIPLYQEEKPTLKREILQSSRIPPQKL